MKYRIKYRRTLPVRPAVALALGVSVFFGSLSAYGSDASDLAKERVAQSETSVEQAQQTLGKSEHGAVELQQARDKLNAAKSALTKKEWREAERAAAQAHLFAELAIAKSQSADARKSANEVLASLEMLRQETERSTPTQR
jgi:hypothetical protein